jgi:hypothetical protein
MLQDMTARVLAHWDRVRGYYFSGVLIHRVAHSQQEHHALLRAMTDRDYANLERLVNIHNRAALAAYMEYIASRHQEGERTA